jgi:hypothetical protein
MDEKEAGKIPPLFFGDYFLGGVMRQSAEVRDEIRA